MKIVEVIVMESSLRAPSATRTRTRKGSAVHQKLLQLATTILSRDGYAGITHQKLMDEAGLGRGSVLHQFPTRNHLIVEIVRHVADNLLECAASHFAGISTPWGRLRAYPEIIWDAANSVPGLALAEIAAATRWDSGLYDLVHQEMLRLNYLYYSNIEEIAKSIDISDLERLKARIQLLIASCHGLVLDRGLHGDNDIIEEARVEMKRDYLRFIAGLVS